MISLCVIVSAVVCLVALVGEASGFPADIQRCHADDTECIRKTVEELFRNSSKAFCAENGFPVLHPFGLELPEKSDTKLGLSSLALQFTDLSIGGLCDLQIERVVSFTSDLATRKVELYGTFPKLILRGKYTADGRYLSRPIQDDGNTVITIVKSKFSVKFNLISKVVKENTTDLGIDKLNVFLDEPESLEINLDTDNFFGSTQFVQLVLDAFLEPRNRADWLRIRLTIQGQIQEQFNLILMTTLDMDQND